MPKRRANGEGNIRKRKDGRWEGRYTVGHDPETGKAIIKNVLGKTQAEVKEKLKKAIEENVGIDYGRAKTYTVGNWLEVWYENYAKIKMRPSTYLTYHGYIENHIKPQLGKIPLNDLTTLHLQQFYKKLLAEGRVERIEAQKQPKGLSAKTVRNIHQIISSALKLAVEQRLIAHNPADGCALPKAERKEMQTLPVEQLTSFLREAKDSGVFALYYIDLTTGLRRGELLGLKWSDIDLEKGDLRVQRQIGRIDGKIIEMPLKTKNAYRPGEDDPHLKVLQAAHISDDEYFSHMVLDDLNLIIRDIRETHKKDSESAPQTTVANELKENLEAVENFKGSRLEKLAVLYCKQLGINYKNLSDEEFRWLIRILQKSKKTGTPINQRKKR